MKAFSVALLVLALCAATFAADVGWVEMSSKSAKGWSWAATFGLIYAGYWFLAGDDK